MRGYAGSAIENSFGTDDDPEVVSDAPFVRSPRRFVLSNLRCHPTSPAPRRHTPDFRHGRIRPRLELQRREWHLQRPRGTVITPSPTALVTDLSTAAALFDMTIVTTDRTYSQQMGLSPATAAPQQAATFTVRGTWRRVGPHRAASVSRAWPATPQTCTADATTIYTSFSGFQGGRGTHESLTTR